jgi:hypothetical protein
VDGVPSLVVRFVTSVGCNRRHQATRHDRARSRQRSLSTRSIRVSGLAIERGSLPDLALKTLAIIDPLSVQKYLSLSLAKLSETLSSAVNGLDLQKEYLGLDQYKEQELWRLERDTVTAVYGNKDVPLAEHIYASIRDRSAILKSKVAFRIRLYLLGIVTGVVITTTLLFSLNLLAGIIPGVVMVNLPFLSYFNVAVFFTDISVALVFLTAMYALIGDPY